jgi:TPR repeat protein
MKYLLFLPLLVILTAVLGAAAYLGISPYHVQLRAELQNPAQRGAAVHTAITFEKLHIRALKGSAPDQYAMARHFVTGDLGFKDADQAANWYRRAAESGDARAQLEMAAVYFTGDNVTRDEAEGVDWMQKASQGGSAEAHDLMGVILAGGYGGPQDLPAAMDILHQAHDSRELAIFGDTEQKLKAAYALPREQRDAEVQKVAAGVKDTVRAQFPALLAAAVASGVKDPAPDSQ